MTVSPLAVAAPPPFRSDDDPETFKNGNIRTERLNDIFLTWPYNRDRPEADWQEKHCVEPATTM